MTRTRSALLWGVVGALAFLVLVQGYRLFVGSLGIGLPRAAGVAVGIGVAVTGISYVAEPRIAAKGRT
ncbi:hypothetical protein [Halobellus salinisoli]|uniref:hypothetical protein n=1 Tax=Halobellus salinisoli TaxID=3108500 RepID=UPI0030091AB7